MSDFVKGRDYEEEDFPRNWPNDRRVQYINDVLSDPTNKSVELLLRDGRIVVRTWFVDHLES
jgi:hypothetical protein